MNDVVRLARGRHLLLVVVIVEEARVVVPDA